MLRKQIEDALLNKYATKETWTRNKDWDWEQPEGPDNQYYFKTPVPRAEQLSRSPWITFLAGDGNQSMRVATINEIVDTIMDRLYEYFG